MSSAMNITKLRLLLVVEEAPNAMPSAAAWMTRPTVVELGLALLLSCVVPVASSSGVDASSVDSVRELLKLN